MNPILDPVLWVSIRNRTRAISFGRYQQLINRLLHLDERQSPKEPAQERRLNEREAILQREGAYPTLKAATETLLLLECGRRSEDAKEQAVYSSPPGIETALAGGAANLDESPGDDGSGFVELIWSYWHEEGMLVATMNVITERFQKMRDRGNPDPLAEMETTPLRPLNNLLWGFIQDDHRLSAKRRAYEYDHHYGLTLSGKAAPAVPPSGHGSKFLSAFHHLLSLCSGFFKSDNDTTVIDDDFPLLPALKEVQISLAEGSHNQFGDLPWTARAEMMLQQWILARPEARAYLASPEMAPYSEAWMPQVETMKTLQSWSQAPVTHFHDLAVYGEQILLSIRYGNWEDTSDEGSAKNWARYWRPELQGYVHAYRVVSGVDLTNP